MSLPKSVTPQLLSRLAGRVPSSGSATWSLTEVYTGSKVLDLPQSGADDVAAACAKARSAQAGWAATPLSERIAVIKKLHKLLTDRKTNTTVVDLIQVESGKGRKMAFEETCDVAMVASHYIKAAPRILADKKNPGPVPVVSYSLERHTPKGVVGIIAPWNFPFAMALSDAIPALIAGNAVVLKPDNKTALSPLFAAELLSRAGLPDGVFQVVCGEGPDVGPPLIDNVNYVMFTGSAPTGKVVGARAAENLIGACLELGGKNPMIVLDDANLDEVIPAALFGAFGNSGQICMHIERIYVLAGRYEEFKQRFVQATKDLVLGAAYDYEPDMGSLISTDHLKKVSEHVEEAVGKGATLLTGGKARPGLGPTFFEPTVLEGVTPEMLAGSCETFGPVVALYPVADVDEAVRLANDTEYGLNASVWGSDLDAAVEVAKRIESGNVNVNDTIGTAYASKSTPSGGVKKSGIGARHGDYGMLKYMDTQNLGVLKKQVLAAPANTPYAKHAKTTLTSLRVMRRTGLR